MNRSPVEARSLPVLQAEIRGCRKCEDAGYIAEANPLTRGTTNARFFIIGQAPSRTDHESGGMYLGPAGRKLRGWFVEAGFDEADFGTTIYFAAITKCFPGRLPGKSTDRLPSRAEQALCRPWLDAEIATVNPAVLVLFGGLAITTFLSRAPLSELVGNVYTNDDGRTVIPLPHSSGASLWLNAPENKAKLARAIDRLREARSDALQ
ncbi:MAG: uracil-DNA glycosylase [Armatimonadetes bacterium]|nr:uracil-DNA glycosylase [Armatimonadota bacterium]